jgi:hypothetical protein
MDKNLTRIYDTHVKGKQVSSLGGYSNSPEFTPQFQRDPETLKFEQNCLSKLINISKQDDLNKNIQPIDNISNNTIKTYNFEDALKELLEFEKQVEELKSSS